MNLSTSAAAKPIETTTAASYGRVLVADDNVVNQKLAQRMLEKLGCKVDLASNGQEAIALAQKVNYDVIFMDCSMPIVDGYEATAALRSTGRHQRIVALTANDSESDRRRCLEAGMDDYLTKPVMLEYFRAALDLSLQRSATAAG